MLLDTNVLVDLASSQRPMHDLTLTAVRQALVAGVELRCLASSLKDVYCICHRHYRSEPTARGYVRHLAAVLPVLDLTSQMVDMALLSNEPDFEDGLIRAAAEASGCTHILTRDAGGFLSSRVTKIDAGTLARMCG